MKARITSARHMVLVDTARTILRDASTALNRLTAPARWLLVCLLGIGTAGVWSTALVGAPVALDGRQLSPSSPPTPVQAKPVRTHVSVDPPGVGGSWIAFSAVGTDGVPGLYLVAPDGSVVRRIAEGDPAQMDRAWSRDGRAIVFCGQTDSSSAVRASECVEELNLASNGAIFSRGLTFFDTRLNPSPDGRAVAFGRVRDGIPQLTSIVVGDVATGSNSVVVGPEDNPGLELDWAPDGSSLAYSAAPTPGVENIWISSADGRHHRRVTNVPAGQAASAPTYSPDGEWIMFRLVGDGSPKLMRIRPDGTDLTMVTQLSTRAPYRLDWSPIINDQPSPGRVMHGRGMQRWQ